MEKKITKFLTLAILLTPFLWTPPAGAAEAKAEDAIGKHRVEGIDVVQGRVFRKRMRHELSVGGGYILNNTFVRSEAIPLQYTFHFREGLAVEGMFMYAFTQAKGIVDDLANIQDCPSGWPAGQPCGVRLTNGVEAMKFAYMANLIWSPIYGKFAIFSKKIFHFDIYLLAGLGGFRTETMEVPPPNTSQSSDRFAFDVGIGTKIFLNDFSAVRVELRNFTWRQGEPFNGIANDLMIYLGAGFFLPPRAVD